MKRSIWGICLTGLMAMIIGAVGIIGVTMVKESYSWTYEEKTEALSRIAKVLEYTQRLKTLPYMAFDDTYVPNYEQQWTQTLMDFEMHMDSFEVYIVTSEVHMAYYEMREAYFNEYKPRLLELLEHMKRDESHDVLPYFIELMKQPTNTMSNSADYCLNLVSENARIDRNAADYAANSIAVSIAVLLILAIVLSIIFLILIARYKRPQHPVYSHSYVQGTPPPVYAMYPVDPSNPLNPPHATHILYPVMNTLHPPQAGETRSYPD